MTMYVSGLRLQIFLLFLLCTYHFDISHGSVVEAVQKTSSTGMKKGRTRLGDFHTKQVSILSSSCAFGLNSVWQATKEMNETEINYCPRVSLSDLC
eukprot:m.48822 g.48822  ORF g.48822 m.48822 type:complete len:96 (-) comp15277_c0_seq4:1418-1705(-)